MENTKSAICECHHDYVCFLKTAGNLRLNNSCNGDEPSNNGYRNSWGDDSIFRKHPTYIDTYHRSVEIARYFSACINLEL